MNEQITSAKVTEKAPRKKQEVKKIYVKIPDDRSDLIGKMDRIVSNSNLKLNSNDRIDYSSLVIFLLEEIKDEDVFVEGFTRTMKTAEEIALDNLKEFNELNNTNYDIYAFATEMLKLKNKKSKLSSKVRKRNNELNTH